MSSPTSEPSALGYRRVVFLVLALAAVTYLMRIVVPMGKMVLDFPTLAYLPQYLCFFVIGAVASRANRFRTLPNSIGIVGFVAAAVAGVLLFPLAFSGRLFSLELSPALANAMGNGHWQSAVYALFDSIFAVGMSLGMITLFRYLLNGQGVFGRFLSRHNYAVYFLHIPIIVFLAYALRGIELASLLKFGLVAVIVVPTCFAVAYLVRRLPFASRIL